MKDIGVSDAYGEGNMAQAAVLLTLQAGPVVESFLMWIPS